MVVIVMVVGFITTYAISADHHVIQMLLMASVLNTKFCDKVCQ